jgi:hypothetical protein
LNHEEQVCPNSLHTRLQNKFGGKLFFGNELGINFFQREICKGGGSRLKIDPSSLILLNFFYLIFSTKIPPKQHEVLLVLQWVVISDTRFAICLSRCRSGFSTAIEMTSTESTSSKASSNLES